MKTGAVVILYNPDLSLAQALIDSVALQVDVLSVIDNSKSPSPLLLDKENLNYHHFKLNIGIAAAQNVGLRDLKLADCDHALLLDQDSDIGSDFVQRLSNQLSETQKRGDTLVAIGPRVICSFSDKIVKPRVQREITVYDDIVCVSQIISSGMMIDLHMLEAIGLKDESLFIDGVDHEWCWRAKQKDLSVAIAHNIQMVHKLGDSRSTFAGITYKVGSPIRLYYQFRNILILIRRPYVPKYWKTRNLLVLPIRFFANSILQNHKKQRLIYMLKGLWDGLLKRDGSYQSNWNSDS